MTLVMEQGDLFDLQDTHYLAHCISSDCGMFGGIAVEFVKRYDMKNKLLRTYDGLMRTHPTCLRIDKVFNLITKENVGDKPTYEDLEISLNTMCMTGITQIAMPKIGCGIDGLEWNKVEKIIRDVFEDTDVNITVRYL